MSRCRQEVKSAEEERQMVVRFLAACALALLDQGGEDYEGMALAVQEAAKAIDRGEHWS